MTFPLLCYRISGWLVTTVIIFLAIFALKNKQMRRGKYLYLTIMFCVSAVTNIASVATAIVVMNNLFLDYILSTSNFTFKTLFLREQYQKKSIRILLSLAIVIFIIITFITAIYKSGYKEIATLSLLLNRVFFIILTVWSMTLMFRKKDSTSRLRQNPDFWFSTTMLFFAFFGIITGIIIDISYKADSDLVLYIVFTSENLINLFITLGYFKAIKLLK